MDGRRPHHRRAAAAHTTNGRSPPTPPTGGRRAHQRRAAAAHTTDGRPRPTQTTGGSRPTPTTAGSRPKARARHALRPVRGPGGRPALTVAAAAPTKEEAGVQRGGATRARGRGDGVGGDYPQFPHSTKKSARPREYPTTAPSRTGGRWGQGHREKSARQESARTTESRVADVGGSTGLTEPSTRGTCTTSWKPDATAHLENNQRARMGTLHHGGHSTHPLRDTEQGVARAGPHPILGGGCLPPRRRPLSVAHEIGEGRVLEGAC